MPSLDFQDVLRSPEFRTKLLVTSTFRRIGLGGVNDIYREHTRSVHGVVIPGKMSLTRLPDGSRVAAFIDVYAEALLTMEHKLNDQESQDADVITWRGNTYAVMGIEDYSQFGKGFYHASCDLQTIALIGRDTERPDDHI